VLVETVARRISLACSERGGLRASLQRPGRGMPVALRVAMQKHTKKKLVLDRVTIQTLTNRQTAGVVGGISGSRCNPTEGCTGMETVCSCGGEPSYVDCPTFGCQSLNVTC
jgi:hypothetical protein